MCWEWRRGSPVVSWGDLASADPELSAFGQERLKYTEVAYLATVDANGAPRVHPVTPFIGSGKLFIFTDARSPKGEDLRRGSRYALHCAVSGTDGGSGEFIVYGAGTFIDDAEIRELASASAPYTPADSYILFELSVDAALSTVYEHGQPKRRRWRAREKLVTQTQMVLAGEQPPEQLMASLFAGKSPAEQKELLAKLERGGAAVYRVLAAAESDDEIKKELLECADREDENAKKLEDRSAAL